MRKSLLFLIICNLAVYAYAQVPSYYDDVNLTLSGQSLRNELATKVTMTQTTFLSYTPGVWQALQQADLDPQNANDVLLIYGYNDTDGVLKTDRTRGVNDNGGASNEWNREHVYPRSLGNPNLGSEGPGSDAHHLRPADPAMNSSRSNRKFADGSGNATITAQGHFYPGDEWKGDVARMMLFMYVRYNDRCLPSAVGVGNPVAGDANMIDLFLNWNVEDPVNGYEDTRNNVIEGIQGNRNPFIDNPALATQIWGGLQAEDRFGAGQGGGDTTTTELFFSEYVEGSSFNKVLEIANFTGTSVNLSSYSLKRQGNGSGSWSSAYALSGTLSSEDVYVIANTQASAAAAVNTDATTGNTALSFNGNDPVGLFKNNVLIDIIGTFNGGSANFAKDVTLRRKSSVSSPSEVYTVNEWDSFSSNTFDGLGNHTIDVGSNGPAPDTEAPTVPTGVTASNITETTAIISWSASSDNMEVVGYDIFRNGTFLSTQTSTSYSATGLTAGTSYSYTVLAKDEAGNTSLQSTAATFTTDVIVLNYCNSQGNNTNFEFIDFVGLGGISNVTAANGGYADFTSQIGNLGYGNNTIVLSVGFSGQSYTENWGVWIDFNQNGTFEGAEQIVTGSTSNTANLSYNFTVPTNALPGNTRMRIAMKWNGTPAACETFSYGEVEDYTVNIAAGRTSVTPSKSHNAMGKLSIENKLYTVDVIQDEDGVTVKLGDSRTVDYTVYNMLGQQIITGVFERETRVSSLQAGVYIIQIFDGQRSLQKKFVKS